LSNTNSFLSLCRLCEELARESGKKELARKVAGYLTSIPIEDAGAAARFLLGEPLPRRQKLNLGPSMLWNAVTEVAPADHEAYLEATEGSVDVGEAVFGVIESFGRAKPRQLWIGDVASRLEEIASAEGVGSVRRKHELLSDLFRGMTPLEAKWLSKIIVGEMRHGVSEGLMVDAVSLVADAERRRVESAFMFAGAIDQVIEGILRSGSSYLEAIAPVLFRPTSPMLAQPCQTVGEALDTMGDACVLEYKLDGARVQVHKDGGVVRLFSRALREMTENLPEIVEECKASVSAGSAILDGEVIATAEDGTPLPFQQLSKRITAEALPLAFAETTRTRLYLFDMLLAEGVSIYDRTFEERRKRLRLSVSEALLVPSLERPSPSEAAAFYAEAVADGHEGLVAKHLESPYRPGARGKHWLKIKKKITLDLVIIGAEYGYGRRHGWLSNYLLATRDERTGSLLPIGKTFKGLTDSEFEAMTERLTSLKTGERRGGITVKPEVVVEVSFGEIQRSRRYESGFALRFARIERIREDMRLEDIDTLQAIRRIHEKSGSGTGKARGQADV
jgi:DNA ligase-1